MTLIIASCFQPHCNDTKNNRMVFWSLCIVNLFTLLVLSSAFSLLLPVSKHPNKWNLRGVLRRGRLLQLRPERLSKLCVGWTKYYPLPLYNKAKNTACASELQHRWKKKRHDLFCLCKAALILLIPEWSM